MKKKPADEPASVLVVDDSDDILAVMVMALEGAGYRVFSATDAVEAFELVRRQRPTVLITDIMLGVTNGLDLITRVRSDLARPLPVIIAMSGFNDVADEALRRGAVRFLPKPFDLDVLLSAVSAATAGRRPSARLLRRVASGARHHREEAAAAATAALTRLAPQRQENMRRLGWTVHWLPRYLGFGHAFVALIENGRLRAVAASEGAPVEIDAPVGDRVPLVRDIAETASSIVLSGKGAPGFGEVHGFFAGVPLRIGRLAVGSFCVVDERPRELSADDFQVLQAFGRRASSVLAGQDFDALPPMWEPSGVLSPGAFSVILSALLHRCHAGGHNLHVAAVACDVSPVLWQATLHEALGEDHVAVAELGCGRYAAVAARPDDEATSVADARALAAWAERADARVGLVTVDCAALAAVSEQGVRRLAEVALARAVARREDGEERVERFTVGRAAHDAAEAAGSGDYEARNEL